MRVGFYSKLAWDGIRKNKRLYFPYILTGSIMVMMYYILSSLLESPSMERIAVGTYLMIALPLGCVVIAVFSLLFLFYTNSFLIRQRYREFGLYNILGMDKKNICRIMVWESLFVAGIAIGTGLAAGIAFSKTAELVMFNLLGMQVDFELYIGFASLWQTALVYGGIYLLLLFNSVLRVLFSKPLDLMQSSKAGEREPKITWLFALGGVVLLAGAYILAVNIEEPLTALVWFFVAVVMVIIGTYLLFIAGSVVFCKLLQKNKGYYYQPNHFVSVSSMVYRMKRNGAGLASICILLTMVLVMISSTASLYLGTENSLQKMYQNDVNVSVTYNEVSRIGDENISTLKDGLKAYSEKGTNITEVRACEIPGLITEDGIVIDFQNTEFTATMYDNVGVLSVISLADYNKVTGKDKTLNEKECLIYCDRMDFPWETFTMEYEETYQVKETLKEFPADGGTMALVAPTVYMVVGDLETFVQPVQNLKNSAGEPMMLYNWRYGFDLETAEEEKSATENIWSLLRSQVSEGDSDIKTINVQSREQQREGFYDLYGSLLFLGIMLSIVFLLAAVLIIYYKQICEGYEDQQRFDIMQKVGMTKRDIRRSINSQMLTVFFLPLLMAGVHLTFAFPFITKIFRMFAFDNLMLSIMVNLMCFAIFGAFYALVYKITSNSYYTIVSGGKE